MQIFMAFDVASAGSHALTLRKSSTPSNDDRKFFVKSVLTACPFALQAILTRKDRNTRYLLIMKNIFMAFDIVSATRWYRRV